jgi:hypothetical protein
MSYLYVGVLMCNKSFRCGISHLIRFLHYLKFCLPTFFSRRYLTVNIDDLTHQVYPVSSLTELNL